MFVNKDTRKEIQQEDDDHRIALVDYNYDTITTDSDMPELTEDSDEDDSENLYEWFIDIDKDVGTIIKETKEESVVTFIRNNQVVTMDEFYGIRHGSMMKREERKEQLSNNIKYEHHEANVHIKKLKEKQLPFDIDKCTFCVKTENDIIYERKDGTTSLIENIKEDSDEEGNINLISDATYRYHGTNVVLNNNVEYERVDEIDDVYSKEYVIKDTNDQWRINVPIGYENGEVVKTELCADPGANSACVKTEWAIEHFPNMIMKNRGKKRMKTPGGTIAPKYCIWMVFPSYSGKILKRRMYLVDQLPVDVIADINMLRAFGYSFPNETPPVFRHEAKDDDMYNLREDNETIGNYNWFNSITNKKLSHTNYINHNNDTFIEIKNEMINMYDEIQGNNVLLFNSNEINKFEKEDVITNNWCETNSMFKDVYNDENIKFDEYNIQDIKFKLIENDMMNHIMKIDNVKLEHEEYELDPDVENVNNMINYINYSYPSHFEFNGKLQNKTNMNIIKVIRKRRQQQCPRFHQCLFLMSKSSFLATREERRKAAKLMNNFNLEFNDMSYLKDYPSKYGNIYNGLYEAITKWISKNLDIFAKKQFDRKTMTVPPARLGINEDEREQTMYAPQYPINEMKRLYMINYTLLNEENKFWKKIEYSLHCIPYTMIPKKKNGVIYLYRPAFDARIVNQHCTLMPIIMPTLKDFRELHAIPGLTTMADIKNCFDCIPLDKRDWKYAVAHTPLGLYMMMHLTYGFMNSAPEAQKIVNQMAIHIGDCLIYIDDICMKHRFELGTVGIIQHLDRLAAICRKFNIQLNPVKFYPACDYVESFGFGNTMIGEKVTKAYTEKLLAVAKPKTKDDIRSFDGIANYMNNHIFQNKLFMHHLKSLEEETLPNKKGKRLKWTPEANLAFEQLTYLFHHLPKLHHPTQEGKFAVQTDACNYGIGGVLWQQQLNKQTNELEWVMIDMYSATMPKRLRNSHSMVHEAYAIVKCIENWQFFLIKRKFIISTDNMPIANIFGRKWKELSPITQKQLIRLRTHISMFSYESYHVKGLNNPVADGLSRFTLKLIEEDRKLPLSERKYPLQLRPINGTNMNTPPITEDEREALLKTIEKSNQLTQEKERLRNDKSMINYTFVSSENMKENENYDMFIKASETSWDSLMQEYRDNSKYLFKEKVKQYIYDSNVNLLRRDESDLNDDIGKQYQDNIILSIQQLSKVGNGTLKEISEVIQEDLKVQYLEQKELYLNKQINQIDEEYQPEDDDIEIQDEYHVQTRSKGKRGKMKTHIDGVRIGSDDDIHHLHTAIRGSGDKEIVREYYETREDLMNKLFGYRGGDHDINDFEEFYNLQQSDNLIQLLTELYYTREEERSEEDLQYLKRWDHKLYKKLINNEIQMYIGLLQVMVYDPILKKKDLKCIVPFTLRGRLMDRLHFDVSSHHESYQQTLNKIRRIYWWSTMKKDVKIFCDHCDFCQFTRGTAIQRAPLAVRELPPIFSHLFADFLGPIYGRYYILVLVDYASGYCRLVPCDGCDAPTVIESLLDSWISTFGWFSKFESDWGSGFNNKLLKAFGQLTRFKIELAEPRNHRSIGKVERVIGIVQKIINRYNQILNQQLTDNDDDILQSWYILQILIPMMQLSLNQRKTRISHISPNMLIFGKNMHEPTDAGRLQWKLKQLKDEKKLQASDADFKRLSNIVEILDKLHELFYNDWMEYTYASKEIYDSKRKITTTKLNRMRSKFTTGKKVLYYIGDRKVRLYKWRQIWTGPWIIEYIINNTSLIITDPTNGNQKRVSFDRIKLFNEYEYKKYNYYFPIDDEYQEYKKKALKQLTNYQVRVREPSFELNYEI